jgi:hypothetical protein
MMEVAGSLALALFRLGRRQPALISQINSFTFFAFLHSKKGELIRNNSDIFLQVEE